MFNINSIIHFAKMFNCLFCGYAIAFTLALQIIFIVSTNIHVVYTDTNELLLWLKKPKANPKFLFSVYFPSLEKKEKKGFTYF